MKEVWINHKLVDFVNAIKQQKIRPGCGSSQEEEPQQHQAQPLITEDDSEGYVQEPIMEPAGEYAKPSSDGSSVVVSWSFIGAAFCIVMYV